MTSKPARVRLDIYICPDCGLPRRPCACSFTGNGVAKYYQRRHAKAVQAKRADEAKEKP